MRKPIFWRDRMMIVVHAKREAEQKHRKMQADMLAQLQGGG
jgi:hypothetical protein